MSDSAIPQTVVCQAPLSMGFSKQKYWSGLPFPSPEDLPDSGIKTKSPVLQADSLPFELVTVKTLKVDEYPNRLRSGMSPGINYLEMQIKTINTVRYHLTHVRMTIIKKSTNNKRWTGVEKREPSYTAGRM